MMRWSFRQVEKARRGVASAVVASGLMLLMVVVWPAGSASALTPAVLRDADWEPRAVRLVSLEDGVLRYYDGGRVLRERATREVVRVRFAERDTPDVLRRSEETRAAGEPGRVLRLTDGQRFFGRYAGSADDGQTLLWRHDELEVIAVPLTAVAGVSTWRESAVVDARQRGEPADTDTVVLRNGDTLSGFVAGLTDDGLELETSDGATLELAWDALRAVTLANPLPEGVVSADVVRLTDGSVFQASRVDIDQDTARFVPRWTAEEAGTKLVPLARVVSIDFAASGVRAVSLTELPATSSETGDVFGLAYPPRLDAQGWLLHAPAEVAFALPAPGLRVIGRARLVLPGRLDPAWQGLVGVTLRFVGAGADEAFPLEPGEGTAFNVGLDDAEELRLELDPGEAGPVLDRVRLEGVTVLLSVPAEPASAADVRLEP